MIDITVSEELRRACPGFLGAAVYAEIRNSGCCEALWEEIDVFCRDYCARYTPESLKDMPSIQATRQAYKNCGKDPSRYRPSGEALVRRVLKGHELYRVNTVVDVINLASIAYGYSIGGFDFDKIKGDRLVLGVGKPGEPYEGIGRGPLNIEGLPVYRDTEGGIGTPTSDHERTKLTVSSARLLTIINGYDGNRQQVEACAGFLVERLKRYAGMQNETVFFF